MPRMCSRVQGCSLALKRQHTHAEAMHNSLPWVRSGAHRLVLQGFQFCSGEVHTLVEGVHGRCNKFYETSRVHYAEGRKRVLGVGRRSTEAAPHNKYSKMLQSRA
eukprot:804815-Pelagomonas_calceolata.AAC.14